MHRFAYPKLIPGKKDDGNRASSRIIVLVNKNFLMAICLCKGGDGLESKE